MGEIMYDPWKKLRAELFRNIEPDIQLVGITSPVGNFRDICTPESLPGFTARASHESKGTIIDDLRLNQDLVKWQHDTPFQAVNFIFQVLGTSKSVQAQWTRHKIGVGWTYRSTRYVSANQNGFIYPTLDYVDSEEKVIQALRVYEDTAKEAIANFDRLKNLGVNKEDSRRVMPVEFATHCFYYTNARALRHLFKLRLTKHAEWEIRRMACMIYDICMDYTPSFFSDIEPLRQAAFQK